MSLTVPLFGDSLRKAAKPWLEELGKSDRERLLRLLKLAVAEKTRLSDVLNTLFYGEDTQTALANLTRLRKRLNDAAKSDPTQGGADLGLQFHVDTKKQSPPTERTVWFTGPDEAVMRVTRFSQQVTADVAGRPFIPSKGIATTGSAMEGKKRVVRFFISYAHENKVLADALVKALRSQFAPSKSYELELWIDRDIMVGEKWHDRILRAIDDCHFGLFMVSPDFLGSRYIGENEIPPFISAACCKPVIPVGLVPVNFDRDELKGLHENQIFFLNGRTFDQMRQAADKTKFARHLRDEMEKRLDAHFAVPTQSDAGTRASSDDEETCEAQAGVTASPDLQRFMPTPEETKHFQRTRGLAHHLAARESIDPAKASAGEARDALDELEAWAVRAEGSPFFALLGEVGIGKTTTLKQFTRQLIEKRQKEPAKYPLPIYIDLRDYVSDKPETVPTIEELLTSVIQRSWRVTDRTVTAGDLLRLVREEGALIIFDGLDEKIVHLTQSRARDFIRTLWSVLPQAMLSPIGVSPAESCKGKMLLSCRSHYFRDVWSQNAMLTGEDREGIDRSQYPAFCLLPFDEAQIRGYLTSFLGDEKRGGEAFELIASIHNLRDLAERPYLLSLISGRLGELEALQMRGETVNAARLYDLVVRSWLSRDDGKHHLDAMHKRRLMEALAAALWRSGEKQWDVDRLEEWFDEFLYRNPAIASAYANKDRSLLKEDLRTATFVLRPDTEAKHFRFAHTSLQEFFLASHLFRALADKADAEWEMPMVSVETLDFLGQILATSTSDVAIASLERILGGECLTAAVLAFKYWLEAIQLNHPEPEPQQVNLTGANFDDCHIKGHSKDRPLNLSRSKLRGVNLNRARVEFVDLIHADLTNVEARQALFLHTNASLSKSAEVDFSGSRWRKSNLYSAFTRGTNLDFQDRIDVTDLKGITELIGKSTTRQTTHHIVPRVFLGHDGWITASAWNSNGSAIATGDRKGHIIIWEADTAHELFSIETEEESIRCLAWCDDGVRLLSGHENGALIVWNTSTGQRLHTLFGHKNHVLCCSWNSDGTHVVSGSADYSIKIWNANNGKLLVSLEDQSDSILCCAWQPNGSHILVGNGKGDLSILDYSGKCESHTRSDNSIAATSCGWNLNGDTVLFGFQDGNILMYDCKLSKISSIDTQSKEWVCCCQWSKDGQDIILVHHDSFEVWDAKFLNCKLRRAMPENFNYSVCYNDSRLFIGTKNSSGIVLCLSRGILLFKLGFQYRDYSTCCEFSPDGNEIAIGYDSDSIGIFDLSSLKSDGRKINAGSYVLCCPWSPDGTRLASSDYDGNITIWDAKSGKLATTYFGAVDFFTSLIWSPTGDYLAAIGSDQSIWIWSEDGINTLIMGPHHVEIEDCKWSPDGTQLLVACGDGSIALWNRLTGKLQFEIKVHDELIRCCEWHPNGGIVFSGSDDGSIVVYDILNKKVIRRVQLDIGCIMCCKQNRDLGKIVFGGTNGTVVVLSLDDGTLVNQFQTGSSSVSGCSWHPSRPFLATCGDTVKLWEFPSICCIRTIFHLPNHQSAVISGDGTQIIHATPEAWRWLGWEERDAKGRFIRRLPAEVFGPIPGMED